MKNLIAILIAAVMSVLASPAWAGPYLNTSAMLLDESFAAGRWVRANLGDKELARSAHKMAQARIDVAAKMIVPAEVREAHPHLLLSLAAMERAMDAAVEGQISNFVRQQQTSSGEAKTFEAVLKGLGFALPNTRHTSMRTLTKPAWRVFGSRPPSSTHDPSRLVLHLHTTSAGDSNQLSTVGIDIGHMPLAQCLQQLLLG